MDPFVALEGCAAFACVGGADGVGVVGGGSTETVMAGGAVVGEAKGWVVCSMAAQPAVSNSPTQAQWRAVAVHTSAARCSVGVEIPRGDQAWLLSK